MTNREWTVNEKTYTLLQEAYNAAEAAAIETQDKAVVTRADGSKVATVYYRPWALGNTQYEIH